MSPLQPNQTPPAFFSAARTATARPPELALPSSTGATRLETTMIRLKREILPDVAERMSCRATWQGEEIARSRQEAGGSGGGASGRAGRSRDWPWSPTGRLAAPLYHKLLISAPISGDAAQEGGCGPDPRGRTSSQPPVGDRNRAVEGQNVSDLLGLGGR